MKGIKPLRERKGLTRAQLAEQLNVSRNRLTMWETLKAWPPSKLLPEIARILGVTIEELYGTPAPAETP